MSEATADIPPVRVRPIRPEDRSEWLRMCCALWPETPAWQQAQEVADFLAGQALEGVPSAVFVAEREGGRLGGFAHVSIKPLDGFETSPVGYVEGWYVDPDLRRQGVGRQLVQACEQWTASQGCSEIGSGCDVGNHVSYQAHCALGFRAMEDLIFLRKPLAASASRPVETRAQAGDWVELLEVPLLAAEALKFVSDPAAGAIDAFLGTTRAETSASGRLLVALHYEAYEQMALEQLQLLARQARQRWPITRLVLLHRLGQVALGEPSVVIAVSCPHRAQAFEACRWLIDTLKSEVAIWKKEIWSDGAEAWK